VAAYLTVAARLGPTLRMPGLPMARILTLPEKT